MRVSTLVLLIVACALLGCNAHVDSFHGAQALTAERRAAVEEGVRGFAGVVAHDVTQDGPIAWAKYFSGGPEFFMAVNGKMALPSGQAAAQAIPEIARVFKHIDLRWGNDLRVDVLTLDLAVMGASYDEVLDYADGHRENVSGYFTGVAELRNGAWQFRDAHWSAPITPTRAQ
jgi:hypothetical protein